MFADERLSAVGMERLHASRYGRVAPWMRQLFRLACRPELEVAALSMGRGGAKTTAAATVAASTFMDECRRGTGGDVIAVAASFEQARILGKDAAALVPDDPTLRKRDSHMRLEIEHTSGARLRVVGSDAGRSMGWRTRLALLDEPASWKPGGAELWAAARTSLGKIPGGRVLLLGTRAYDPGHWWERVLSDPPAATEVLVWSAPEDADVLDRRSWMAANPSLRTLQLPAPQTLANEAAAAIEDPAAMATFRALRLNAGTPLAVAGVLFDPDAWAALPPAGGRAGPLMLGVDLGGSASLSA